MIRSLITLPELVAYDNLLLATWKAARGKRRRPAVSRFLTDLDGALERLARSILDGTAPRGACRRFIIHDPKRREITAVCFADRVLHHAILNRAEPRFERMLVDSTYACRPGKGVHAAVTRVQSNLRRWPWLVKIDIDGYFPSIDHARLKRMLAARFKGRGFLDLLARIIDRGSHDSPGRGLPIGALTSQHFANAYLDPADRWLLGHPEVCGHVRYMDDIVWWCPSRAAAQGTLDGVRTLLADDLGLAIKSGAYVGPSAQGLTFCGFRVRSGVILASSRKLSRYRAGLKRIETAWAAGEIGEGEHQRASEALLATLAAAETLGFRRRLGPIPDDGDIGGRLCSIGSGCRSKQA